jgi:hypothetical protein
MLDFLVERKLAEAVSRGELDDLPGQGKPLDLDDDPLVPEDLRLAYRILKNAGFAPREVKAANQLELMTARIEGAYFKKVLRRLR